MAIYQPSCFAGGGILVPTGILGTATTTITVGPVASTSTATLVVQNGKPDYLAKAKHRQGRVSLGFADGNYGTYSFQELELNMAGMKLATIRAAADGKHMEVDSNCGETVRIDSQSLRASIDPIYASKLEKVLVSLRGPLNDFIPIAARQ
jgi:hypothetical protein